MEQLKYPIGKLSMPKTLFYADRQQLIQQINMLPRQLRSLVEGTTEEQQQRTYRVTVHGMCWSSYTILQIAMSIFI